MLNKKWSKNIDGGVSQEEVLIAFDMLRDNNVVKKHFAKTDSIITLHGGFNFQDDKLCKLGNRCVHIFASTKEVAILAHSIIRLFDAKVVYPNYDMVGQGKLSGKIIWNKTDTN